jgi:hypothetical protein
VLDVLPPPFVENIPRGRTSTKKLPVYLRLMPPTAKTFNLRRHYADNNSANLLADKLPKGRLRKSLISIRTICAAKQ